MRSSGLATSVAIGIALLTASVARAEASQTSKVQSALETWLADRAAPEKVTGVAAYVSFGDPGPSIEAFAGKVGTDPGDSKVGQGTLFQMGSTSKSFAAAVILKLEADGKLSLDDTIGKWLPQYPAWKDVTVRRLLNMTSGIPNYSEAEIISRTWIDQPSRDLTAEELVKVAYPTGKNDLPPSQGYHYSNTNYVLAGMIAAKATGRSYRDLVHEMVIDAFGLGDTFYENGTYPAAVTRRLAHGYFDNPACTDYQPNCKQSWNLPLMGRDTRNMSSSWAQAAGGAVADARDVDRWMRAVFAGRVVPPAQQAQWMALVSTKTGLPIADVSSADPGDFRSASPRRCSDRWVRSGSTRARPWLPDTLRLVREGEPDDHPSDQLPTRGRRRQAQPARRNDPPDRPHRHELRQGCARRPISGPTIIRLR